MQAAFDNACVLIDDVGELVVDVAIFFVRFNSSQITNETEIQSNLDFVAAINKQQNKTTMSVAVEEQQTKIPNHTDHVQQQQAAAAASSSKQSSTTVAATTVAAVLYDDTFTALSTSGVEIRWYVFPTAQSKTFSWNDVEAIDVTDRSVFNCKSWGSNSLYRWFGCHMLREFNSDLKKVVAFKLRGAKWQPCVTPLRHEDFIRICQQQIANARRSSANTPK